MSAETTEGRETGALVPPSPAVQHHGQVRIAYRLARQFNGKLLHVHSLGWHFWDGRRWAEDHGGHAVRAVLAVLRSALYDALGDSDLKADVRKCESSAGINGVLDIAAALPEFAATVTDLDADPYLINCANGTLDLLTLELRAADPADRITKVTTAAYDPGAAGPTWAAFLARVLPNAEVRGFLQRYVGLGLAGCVLEHILAILTGPGRNGKGVLYRSIGTTLGDYSAIAEPDLFMHRENAHPTGEMDLRGTRWVVVSESDQDRRLAEATVKRLTGGDMIKARRMRQDFVEFAPSHTAALVTNHLPRVSGDDPAIWARLRVILFDVVIPEAERDAHLPEKLELEADAILSWAVAGWADYQQHGLTEPAPVLQATEAYHVQSDAVARFLDERCLISPEASATTGQLYTEWSQWCRAEGVEPGSAKTFGQSLDRKGFSARKTRVGMLRDGLGLLVSQQE